MTQNLLGDSYNEMDNFHTFAGVQNWTEYGENRHESHGFVGIHGITVDASMSNRGQIRDCRLVVVVDLKVDKTMSLLSE